MKYLKVVGSLTDLFLSRELALKATSGVSNSTGLKYSGGRQNAKKGVTMFEIEDEDRASKYMKIGEVFDTTESANKCLSKEFDEKVYSITSEVIVGANLNQLIANGQIDLSVMDADWTEQEELEFLYNNGVSGITIVELVTKKY